VARGLTSGPGSESRVQVALIRVAARPVLSQTRRGIETPFHGAPRLRLALQSRHGSASRRRARAGRGRVFYHNASECVSKAALMIGTRAEVGREDHFSHDVSERLVTKYEEPTAIPVTPGPRPLQVRVDRARRHRTATSNAKAEDVLNSSPRAEDGRALTLQDPI
jgi:hypothetical protein